VLRPRTRGIRNVLLSSALFGCGLVLIATFAATMTGRASGTPFFTGTPDSNIGTDEFFKRDQAVGMGTRPAL